MPLRPKSRAAAKAERAALERRFLAALLADIDAGDLRQAAARYPGVTWRDFLDPRHQALWRAFQTLDLKGVEERVDALIAESGEPPEHFEDNRGAVKDLYKLAAGPKWLEHELAAAGVLTLAGGKAYIRELCEGEGYENKVLLTAMKEEYAKQLGFAREEKQ